MLTPYELEFDRLMSLIDSLKLDKIINPASFRQEDLDAAELELLKLLEDSE